MALLPFAQLEFPGELALGDGRYLVRPENDPDADPDVLVLKTLGAQRARRRLRRGRPSELETEPEPTPLPLTRVTVVKALPFDDEASAQDWLAKVGGEEELSSALATEVARTLNRATAAHRVSAPDPYALPVQAGRAAAVRFGFGSGEEVASGRWSAAIELNERSRRSLRAEIVDGVGAQERVAGVLGGRDSVGIDEQLLLDAELAEAEGRTGLAAVLLAASLDAAERGGADVGEARGKAMPLSERALSGGSPDPAALRDAARAVRRAVRAG